MLRALLPTLGGPMINRQIGCQHIDTVDGVLGHGRVDDLVNVNALLEQKIAAWAAWIELPTITGMIAAPMDVPVSSPAACVACRNTRLLHCGAAMRSGSARMMRSASIAMAVSGGGRPTK